MKKNGNNKKHGKSNLNLSIDLIMFVLLAALAGIGYMLKWVLLPGFKRNLEYGSNHELYFWGLDRHQWGDIHLIISFALVALLLLHIILHWKMIINFFKRMIPGIALRRVVYSILTIVLLALFIVPAFVKPEIGEVEPLYRNRHLIDEQSIGDNAPVVLHRNQQIKKLSNEPVDESSKPLNNNSEKTGNQEKVKTAENQKLTKVADHEEEHLQLATDEDYESIEIYGYMNISGIAKEYDLNAGELCKALNIPEEYKNQKLGLLRRDYNFRMSDLKKIIYEKKFKK